LQNSHAPQHRTQSKLVAYRFGLHFTHADLGFTSMKLLTPRAPISFRTAFSSGIPSRPYLPEVIHPLDTFTLIRSAGVSTDHFSVLIAATARSSSVRSLELGRWISISFATRYAQRGMLCGHFVPVTGHAPGKRHDPVPHGNADFRGVDARFKIQLRLYSLFEF
jgi:hypothetical protein